ncbi:MAG: ATP-binding protein [Micrococcales bacterium]|nr:ATP-binding protein [Micrococcales bacterium]MCL2667077.1 ATP-binding protein [Micrococcales bacterium]
MSHPRVRNGRQPHVLDVRPLDQFPTIKLKLGVLVLTVVGFAAGLTWFGLSWLHLGLTRTFPVVFVVSLVLIQVLARGMTSPLREMTSAVRAMAAGDYSRRVRATSRDEVGQLAVAFNSMAADLEHADTTRRELIANVSHELRTPVAALRAQLENMVDRVTEPTPAALGVALAQTERLSTLISQLLDLSRIEAGAGALDMAAVHVGALAHAAVSDVRVLGQARGLRYTVEVEPADLRVPGDRERLHQVLTNLLANATRHSPNGGEVVVRGSRVGPDVRIDVVDSGPGIAPEQRAHLFERFARGNTPAITGRASTGGTGLGLAIVRLTVGLHGGTIEVADAAQGATMRITLPATASPAQ